MNQHDTDHWLVRARTIRRLWYGSLLGLSVTVLLELLIPVKGYFGVDNWIGFGAVFGFGACLLMVLVAKALGLLLKRPEDYYSRSEKPIGEAGEDA